MIRSCTKSRSVRHPRKLGIPPRAYIIVSDEDVFKIEDELISLDPKSFDSIQDFIIKVNELRTKLIDCGTLSKMTG